MVAAIVVLTLFYKVLALEVPRTQFLTGGHDNSLTEQDSMERRSILTSSLSLPSSRSLRSPPRAIVHSFFTCTIVSLLCLSQQDAWGVEALRNQLLHAKTISLQGTELIYNEHRPDDAPVRVPIELSIERPNKFRFQYSIVSNGDGPPEISNALLLCDGHIET